MDDNWLHQFDAFLKRFFGIDHFDAGLDLTQMMRYADLKPEEAALTFGQDYDLDRIDGPWGA